MSVCIPRQEKIPAGDKLRQGPYLALRNYQGVSDVRR